MMRVRAGAQSGRRGWLVVILVGMLVSSMPSGPAVAGTAPRTPTSVRATVGPGSATVAFDPAPGPPADSYTVVSHPEGVRAHGTASPITVVGLAAWRSYTFTVTATNSSGTSASSEASNAVTPTGPVTNVTPLATDRTFVNQTVSFYSRTAGTVSSRRPTTFDSERPSNGVPAGREWRLLWLRATNCEGDTREIEFFTYDTQRNQTTSYFVEGHRSTTTPLTSVAVPVPPGDTLGWTGQAAAPLILPAGSAVGVRWLGMTGDGGRCNWQFAAIEQPAGTAATGATDSPPPYQQGQVAGAFFADVAGTRASWRTVPTGQMWMPRSVDATNCEPATRTMEVLLLGPGRIHHGGLVSEAAAPTGIAQVPVAPGQHLTWNAAEDGKRLVLPSGWSVGIRWHDMTGTAPSARCTWSVAFDDVGPASLTGGQLDAVLSQLPPE